MILDDLANAARYYGLHPRIRAGLEFLQRTDLAALAQGRHEIDGAKLFVLVSRDPGRGRAGAKLEVHRKHVDIQLTIAGNEEIGWSPIGVCREIEVPYDAEGDGMLFADRPATWVQVAPRRFTIFFPEDAHAPLGGEGELHKAVVKVAL
jgi:YhcH/YjgK/YiaL family protein